MYEQFKQEDPEGYEAFKTGKGVKYTHVYLQLSSINDQYGLEQEEFAKKFEKVLDVLGNKVEKHSEVKFLIGRTKKGELRVYDKFTAFFARIFGGVNFKNLSGSGDNLTKSLVIFKDRVCPERVHGEEMEGNALPKNLDGAVAASKALNHWTRVKDATIYLINRLEKKDASDITRIKSPLIKNLGKIEKKAISALLNVSHHAQQ